MDEEGGTFPGEFINQTTQNVGGALRRADLLPPAAERIGATERASHIRGRFKWM
jgi:hypothetical protein